MNHARRYLILPLLLAIAACNSSSETTASKYPYPVQFVGPDVVPARFLAEPAPDHSPAYDAEIAGIITGQAKLTEAEKATIMAEDSIVPAMIVEPVLGKEFTAEKYPATFLLLRHAASDAWRDADVAQDYWNRQRPWLTDSHVQLLVKPITRPSYPSGHSTTNHVWAYILSNLFPEKREALFARAYEIGMHRSLGGVHYPSDVEAGKQFAEQIYANMQANPAFQKEFAAAQAEILAAAPSANPVHVLDTDGETRTNSTLVPRGSIPATPPSPVSVPASASQPAN